MLYNFTRAELMILSVDRKKKIAVVESNTI